MAKLTKIKEDRGVRKEIKKRRYSREELREIQSNRKDRGERSSERGLVSFSPRKETILNSKSGQPH